MNRRGIWIGAALVWVTSGAPSAWATPPEAAPNLLLISIDTLRRDHCSVYAYDHDTTPHLRKIAERGARFDLAYAPAPSTAPTHASILTGLYPPSHGLIRNGVELSASNRTLAEILAAAGYQTAAVVSSFVLDAQFGFDQGFAHYDDDFAASESAVQFDTWEGHAVPSTGFDRPANAATRQAMRWLWEKRDPQRPFFLFVHYFDPHAPYRAPPPYDRRFPSPGPEPGAGPPGSFEFGEAVRNYDGEIAFTDHEIGRLLEALEHLGLADDTLLVVTADHGEGLMDHGHMAHGLSLHEELVRVPLLLRWPGKILPGRSYTEPVELVDIAPTVVELLDLPTGTPAANQLQASGLQASRFQGRSLAAWLRGKGSPEAKPPVRPVFLFRRHFAADFVEGIRVKGALSGIRLGKWKLIEATDPPRRELYDLESDPRERVNRLHDQPEVAARLADALATHRRGQPSTGTAPTLPDRVRRALRALGYTE
ncbi:MAG: sulfatase [Myxococcota bacterium]